MPDTTIVKSDGSAERVAFDLMHDVIRHEDAELTRDYILDLFAECLTAAKGGRNWKSGKDRPGGVSVL